MGDQFLRDDRVFRQTARRCRRLPATHILLPRQLQKNDKGAYWCTKNETGMRLASERVGVHAVDLEYFTRREGFNLGGTFA